VTQRHAEAPGDENVYLQHRDFLISIAVRKFGVPSSDAESLVNEVFTNYLKHTGEIHDIHAWLLGAMCHASRYYWRQHGRVETVEIEESFEREAPDSEDIPDARPDALTARAILDAMPPRYQVILRMRYYEGCSIAEIAERLGVKPKYAQKLVSKCIKKAEQTYLGKSTRDLEHVVKGFVDPYRKAG
jgi:RNA polymerase sigma factor (sigma-70 family)